VAQGAVLPGFVALPDLVLVAIEAGGVPVSFAGEDDGVHLAVAVGTLDFLLPHVELVAEEEGGRGRGRRGREVQRDPAGALADGAPQAEPRHEEGEDGQDPSVFM
jgi:hypothetical protein